MNRKRVVIAGLGDAGVLIAIRLSRYADVVGISVKPALVSGQELGIRLSRPDDWARDYWIPFDRFRRLDQVRTVTATLSGVDLAARTVFGRGEDGATITEEYDALVISTGVTNGFWRRPTLQSAAEIGAELRCARPAGCRQLGDRRRRRRGSGQQRRQHGNDLAGEAGRPLLPRRVCAERASSADLESDSRTADRPGRRHPPRPPRRGVRWLRRR